MQSPSFYKMWVSVVTTHSRQPLSHHYSNQYITIHNHSLTSAINQPLLTPVMNLQNSEVYRCSTYIVIGCNWTIALRSLERSPASSVRFFLAPRALIVGATSHAVSPPATRSQASPLSLLRVMWTSPEWCSGCTPQSVQCPAVEYGKSMLVYDGLLNVYDGVVIGMKRHRHEAASAQACLAIL